MPGRAATNYAPSRQAHTLTKHISAGTSHPCPVDENEID